MKTEDSIANPPEDSAKPRRRGRALLAVLLIVAFLGGAAGLGYNYYKLHHETTEDEIKQIESLIVAGKGDDARALMIGAQTRSKDADALRLRIGRAFLHEGNVGPAVALLSKVENSLVNEERMVIAEYFLVAGDPFSAVRFYDAAFKAGLVRTAPLLGRYGEAQSLAGNGDAAVAAFRESLAMDDSRLRVRQNLAMTLANLNRLAEAKVEAQAILKIDPRNEKVQALLSALQSAH